MHHVPIDSRAALTSEVARIVSGPIYVKDHLATLPSIMRDFTRLMR
jgi:hypothetical protein